MIGILVVSHSADAARGIAEIARGMAVAGDDIPIVGVGGNDDGGLGVSVAKIADALTEMLPKCEGILIVPDLGSSILSSRAAVGMLSGEEAAKIVIVDAPVLEGAMMAAVEASTGSDLQSVVKVAEVAKNLIKIDH
ncbi:MAG: PTS mannose transporter subunit IID [Synergistaceae bacterium]|jgi:dihydroxyacetone kinase phosphotransfer subunit|nr:PTS mannose transporter subunit IID [Synergistaceae bacterium]